MITFSFCYMQLDLILTDMRHETSDLTSWKGGLNPMFSSLTTCLYA